MSHFITYITQWNYQRKLIANINGFGIYAFNLIILSSDLEGTYG